MNRDSQENASLVSSLLKVKNAASHFSEVVLRTGKKKRKKNPVSRAAAQLEQIKSAAPTSQQVTTGSAYIVTRA